MSLLSTITVLAAEGGEERSETPFFVVGICLAAFAVLISVLGFTRPAFPTGNGGARAVMLVGVVLVAATMFFAVWIAN